jgi:hypothetical protein
MRTKLLQQITTLTSALLLSAAAWAAPTTGAYVSDPQTEYVQDATSDSIGSVNMILCIISGMNINGSAMLNKGPYIALIDLNQCQSHGSSSSSSSGSSGASAAKNYMTAIVDATRGAGSTDPMLANIWMSMTEQGHQINISLRLSATQSPTDVPPYGVFRLDYIGKASGVIQFNGYIDSTSGNLKFYETGANSSNTALSLTPGTSNSGSGTITTGLSPVTTFDFNYNSSNFRRSDSVNDRCFDRTKANADKSVWRYGTYNNSDGTRVDQANPSFPVIATYLGNSYYGYTGYYGIGFQGLDLNSVSGTNPISGLVVTDQRPGNTTTYNLSKVGGKLTKWTQNATTLSAMDGIPFTWFGNLTGLTTGNTAVTGTTNWQMQWNNSGANFTVTGVQSCGSNGCTLATVSPVATVSAGAFNNIPLSGWSDSFGGSINIAASTTDHVSGDAVNYFSQSTVIPGSAGAPTALNCLSNCPDATSVAAANTFTGSTGAPSPFGGTTATQWFSAPSAGNTVSYTFDAGGLKQAGTSMAITNASFYAASPNFQWGVMTGRLFDTALVSCFFTSVCEPSNPTTYYTWQTGTGQWNQSMWLTKTSDNSVVAFDPPQNIAYTVPSGAAYGTWAGKQIQLQFNGFGNVYGIPGYCIDPVNNSQTDCSTANARYVSMFSIPDAATMSLNSTTLIVKALDAELRLKDLGAGASTSACSGLTLAPLIPPTGGTHDMTSSLDAYYIGVKPTITGNPKVIDGVVQ